MKLELSRKVFEKYSNIKIHKNPSSRSRVVLWGKTDGQTGMTKLTVAFLNFANAPKKTVRFADRISPPANQAKE